VTSNNARVLLSFDTVVNGSTVQGSIIAGQQASVVVGATDTGTGYMATLDVRDRNESTVLETVDIVVTATDPVVMVEPEDVHEAIRRD